MTHVMRTAIRCGLGLAFIAALAAATSGCSRIDDEGGSNVTVEEWTERLADKQVKPAVARGPGRLEIDLCRDGVFTVQFGVDGESGIPLGTGVNEQREGKWKVAKIGSAIGIELSYPEGEQARHAIEDRRGEFHVDGVKWVIEPSTKCQG